MMITAILYMILGADILAIVLCLLRLNWINKQEPVIKAKWETLDRHDRPIYPPHAQ